MSFRSDIVIPSPLVVSLFLKLIKRIEDNSLYNLLSITSRHVLASHFIANPYNCSASKVR